MTLLVSSHMSANEPQGRSWLKALHECISLSPHRRPTHTGGTVSCISQRTEAQMHRENHVQRILTPENVALLRSGTNPAVRKDSAGSVGQPDTRPEAAPAGLCVPTLFPRGTSNTRGVTSNSPKKFSPTVETVCLVYVFSCSLFSLRRYKC